MLALAEMLVVIAPTEKITLGMRERITAEMFLKFIMKLSIKCHRDELTRNCMNETLVNLTSEKPKFGRGIIPIELN